MPEAMSDAVDIDVVDERAENKPLDVVKKRTGNMFEALSVAELVQRVIGHGAINRETNSLCAQILNHPEVHMHPEVLPLYASYNGKLYHFSQVLCFARSQRSIYSTYCKNHFGRWYACPRRRYNQGRNMALSPRETG